MFLTLPSSEYKESFIAAVKEFKEEGRPEGNDLEAAEHDFEGFVAHLREEAEGKNLPEGYVSQTVFWLADDGEFIGRVSIRHSLTPKLEHTGGHIGYAIRPSKRKMGYGKKILELALLEAKKLGIERALLTCDASNVGSKKIIEAAGGKLENEVEGDNGPKRRYWIPL